MFSHVMLGADDIDASKAFYDATIQALGGRAGRADDKGRVAWMHGGGVFMLSRPIDGQPACHANGGTVGFAAASPEMVDAWHAAGLAAGGTAIEDPPGKRSNAFGSLYLAYLRDPTGNKVCATHRMPAA
ncbi:VOC family protein [Sphingomonas sp. RS2018]